MAEAARERLARLLGDSEPVGVAHAQLRAPLNLVELAVGGVGAVGLPVRAAMAKTLISVARAARFGRGEETLTDSSVRDTWELTPDQFTVSGPEWAELLERALRHFRDELGLPRTAPLRAEPHAMLVYGKGQFFLPHQDSEKDDTMVGTMVLSLPSVHTGGELVIDHGGQSTTYRASREELTFVAFYADCRHQVLPVRSGYRVTLTFNLLLEAGSANSQNDSGAELSHCLTEHFTTSATPRYGERRLGVPERLVFLLDHEYTQRGLDWHRLKGADTKRAALLRTAAERAGYETVLALAEVQETWNAFPANEDPWMDHDESGEDTDDLEVTDLIEDEITLGWWTDPDGGGGESISLHVPYYEVCATTPSVALEPYQSEYEGYMGNYGNTLDRWYRRAAVVVWPQDRAFTARAEADPQRALRELRGLVDAGQVEAARTAAESLVPFWPTIVTRVNLLGAVLDLAASLDAAETTAMLLKPFRVEALLPEHAAGLAAAAEQYGEEWTRGVVASWFRSAHYVENVWDGWIEATLAELSGTLWDAGQEQVAQLLAAGSWRRLKDRLQYWTASTRTETRQPQLAKLSSSLVQLLVSADGDLRDQIIETIRGYPDNVLECVMPALRLAVTQPKATFDALARDCVDRIEAIIVRPPRAEDDWSIAWVGCGCGLCDTLGAFLSSSSRRAFEWPLAKDRRQHIHTRIDLAGLPVRHLTRRQGRPFTLVLTKTGELFTRAANAREQAATDMAWLTSTWFRPLRRG